MDIQNFFILFSKKKTEKAFKKSYNANHRG